MLHLSDDWVWDFWVADDGRDYHLFFLTAPRTLGDPESRHRRARVGHAVSPDLVEWRIGPDALGPDPAGAGFDDLAIWTGSVHRAPDGSWLMFYTGATEGRHNGIDQRVGIAVSDDLWTWRRYGGNPVSTADPRWYETAGDTGAVGEEWRDPWLLRDPGGDGWHLIVCARSKRGPADDRGVLGHARSHDLVSWEPQPPLTAPGAGFGQLEVPQVAEVDGRHVLLFSCLRDRFARTRRARSGGGGVWAAAGRSPLGPFDVAHARPLTNNALYAGRLVRRREGDWVLLAFRTWDDRGMFVGGIGDPLPVLPDLHGGIVARGGFAAATWRAAGAASGPPDGV